MSAGPARACGGPHDEPPRRRRRPCSRVQLRDRRLAARERLVERRQVADDDRQHAEPARRVDHLHDARECIAGPQPVGAGADEARSAEVEVLAEVRRAAGRDVRAARPLQARVAHHQPRDPQREVEEQPERAVHPEQRVADRVGKAQGEGLPRFVEEDRDAPRELRVALDPPRQQEREEDLEQHQPDEHTTEQADNDPHPAGTIRARLRNCPFVSEGWIVRPMTAADLDAACAISNAAFGALFGLPAATPVFGALLFSSRFEADPAGCFVAAPAGDPSRVLGSLLSVARGPLAWFGPLAVDPGAQQGGAGAALVEECLSSWRQRGVRTMGLETLADSAHHVRFYARFGFRPSWTGVAFEAPLAPTDMPDGIEIGGAAPQLDFLYPGIDLAGEIAATSRLGCGKVLTTYDGLAICHTEPTFQHAGRRLRPVPGRRLPRILRPPAQRRRAPLQPARSRVDARPRPGIQLGDDGGVARARLPSRAGDGADEGGRAPRLRPRRLAVSRQLAVKSATGSTQASGLFSPPDVPVKGQTVNNLLSEGIVKADGTPGPNFPVAEQKAAYDVAPDAFMLSPSVTTSFDGNVLPAPINGGPTDSYVPNDSLQFARQSENGLPADYYAYLVTGGSGLTGKVPDTRIKNVSALPPGPFQLTNGDTFTYNDYAASPVHRFYQMWQQLDCSVAHATATNPSGCDSALFPWVETTVGAGTNGLAQPVNFSTDYSPSASITGEGSTAMGFYNVQNGDAPYFKYLADTYSMSDNFHQSVNGWNGRQPHHVRPWRHDLVQRRQGQSGDSSSQR